jgi:predicted dehydrogenase
LARKKQLGNCDDYNDFRELLAREDVDAVHISTADHWHVPISLAAARAGKDMYTEKPLGISIEQVLAAREIGDKHKRIFQYGTQNRSMIHVRMGTELVLNGHIGEVKELYVWCPPGESGGSATPVLPVPEGFDYDMWLGPAPEVPFCADRCLRQTGRNGIFHIYDYAIGFIAGWGAHPLDQLQWWADQAGLTIPVKYEGTGTIPKEGLFDTTTNWDMTCSYANGLTLRFLDNVTAREGKKIPNIDQMPNFYHGTMYVGTEGWVTVTRSGWKVYPESLYRKGKEPGKIRLIQSLNQRHNFIESILNKEQPISDLKSSIKSDLISHLCDISIRTGRTIHWDPEKETIVGDNEAKKMMSRPMREPWTL